MTHNRPTRVVRTQVYSCRYARRCEAAQLDEGIDRYLGSRPQEPIVGPGCMARYAYLAVNAGSSTHQEHYVPRRDREWHAQANPRRIYQSISDTLVQLFSETASSLIEETVGTRGQHSARRDSKSDQEIRRLPCRREGGFF